MPEVQRPFSVAPAQGMASQFHSTSGTASELFGEGSDGTMTISIPLVAIVGALIYIAWRYMGLRVWQAVVCLVFGFLLAATTVAPDLHNLITGFVQWLTTPRSVNRP
jgi:hypothetical protein